MDGQRFDSLARTLAGGRSRRGILKALGAGALGLFGVKQVTEDASATMCLPNDIACTFGENCCSGSCLDNVCVGRPIGSPCDANNQCAGGGLPDSTVACIDGFCATEPECAGPFGACDVATDCCDGLECIGGLCIDPDGICRDNGFSCISTNDCCDDLVCSNGFCGTAPVCTETGSDCAENSECCSGICQDGTCAADGVCLGYYDLCQSDDQCCSGFCQDDASHAYFGQCYGADNGGTCTASTDCVNYEYGDICESGLCCRGEGGVCANHGECCSGSCQNGACAATGEPTPTPTVPVEPTVPAQPTQPAQPSEPVTRLPATGSGPDNESAAPVIATVAGAAALVGGGALLRQRSATPAAKPETGK